MAAGHSRGTDVERRAGLLDGLSAAQVAASGLAAATSFALASKIGIAGSIIGVAVSAVASVVASQVYRNLFDASARKLRALGSDAAAGDAAGAVDADQDPRSRDAAGAATRAGSGTARPRTPSELAGGAHDRTVGGGRIAPAEVRIAAHEREQRRLRRRAAVVAAVVGVVAVAASALVVSAATHGEGLGTRPEPIVQAAPQAGHDAAADGAQTPSSPQGDPQSAPEPAPGDAGHAQGASPLPSDGDGHAPQAQAPDEGAQAPSEGPEAVPSRPDGDGGATHPDGSRPTSPDAAQGDHGSHAAPGTQAN